MIFCKKSNDEFVIEFVDILTRKAKIEFFIKVHLKQIVFTDFSRRKPFASVST